MQLHEKRAIFFDAGFTLLEPTIPVPEVYYAKAREVGVALDEPAFRQRLAGLWATLNRGYRSAHDDLASSEELERDAWRRFLLELARPFTELAAAHSAWTDRLFAHFDSPEAWQPIPGAMDLLCQLRQRKRTVGVVSNWHAALHGILAHHRLTEQLDFVLTSAEVGRKKPHRHIFETAIRTAGVASEEAAHIGDTWHDDVEGARAAGIMPIYFRRGRSHPGADPTVHAIDCLTELMR